MPAPESQYKKRFFQLYPEFSRTNDRRNVLTVMRRSWQMESRKEQSLPTLRTMRQWRSEFDQQTAGVEPWTDPPWDGQTADNVPIGWLLGLHWIANKAQGSGLTQSQAKHAIRLYGSLDLLDLAGVWVLVNEYAKQDEMKHLYNSEEYGIFTETPDLDAIITFRPWTSEGKDGYSKMISQEPTHTSPGVRFFPAKTDPQGAIVGPPLFLGSQVEYGMAMSNSMAAQLAVHFAHTIGNPLVDNDEAGQLLSEETIKKFDTDPFESMSWQEIVAQGESE